MTDNKLADALHVLLAACDDSDSAMYGTLGVSFVRDVAQAALAEHDSTSAAPDAPAPVQVDVLGELADEIEDTYPNADASNLRAFAAPPPTKPPEIGSKSVVEPTAEHWRMAIKERGIENPKALDWIEQRARELAKVAKC